MKYFAVGAISCCISHGVTTPLDVVKTRQQSDPDRYRHAATGKPLSMFGTGALIAKQEGMPMLLQGMSTTRVAYLIQGGVKYSLWEAMKVVFGFREAVGHWRIFTLIGAAFVAEVFASLLLCPFERVRIQLVTNPAFATGPVQALMRKVKEEGLIGGLYGEGLAPTLVKQTGYTIAKLTTFTMLLEWCLRRSAIPRVVAAFLSSITAGLVASLASQPGDTLLTCTSTQRRAENCPVDVTNLDKRPSLFQTARLLGWRNLFMGWRPRLLQIEIIVVTQLILYDCLKQAIGVHHH